MNLIGHLGIFVSSGVARKQHGEFSSNIDFIDTLPPGLYEAVFEARTADSIGADLISGDWVMQCERRTLDDIRALGGNDSADERRFVTAARVSEINLALYRTFAAPLVRAMTSAQVAEWARRIHPLRLQYEIFSDANPFMAIVKNTADHVRKARKPVANDNPYLALQGILSEQIIAGLDTWRQMAETLAERTFLTFYGSPLLQAAVGIDPADDRPHRKAGKPPLHRELLQNRIAELKNGIATGGLRECLVRGMIYIAAARGSVDERTFAAICRLRATQDESSRLTLADFKSSPARAILYAADRRGRYARRHSRLTAVRPSGPPQSLRDAASNPEREWRGYRRRCRATQAYSPALRCGSWIGASVGRRVMLAFRSAQGRDSRCSFMPGQRTATWKRLIGSRTCIDRMRMPFRKRR